MILPKISYFFVNFFLPIMATPKSKSQHQSLATDLISSIEAKLGEAGTATKKMKKSIEKSAEKLAKKLTKLMNKTEKKTDKSVKAVAKKAKKESNKAAKNAKKAEKNAKRAISKKVESVEKSEQTPVTPAAQRTLTRPAAKPTSSSRTRPAQPKKPAATEPAPATDDTTQTA